MKRTVRMSLLRRSAAPSTSGFAHSAIWSNGIDDATSIVSHERAYLQFDGANARGTEALGAGDKKALWV